MQRLEGRVAVITGAASGIGRALAAVLAERGCRLALVDWNPDALAETAAVLPARARLSTHVVDVADRAAMEQLVRDVISSHGGCHILVNNAGVAIDATIEEVSFDDFAIRLRLGPETYAGDWLKRIFPEGTQRIVGWLTRRVEQRLRAGAAPPS